VFTTVKVSLFATVLLGAAVLVASFATPSGLQVLQDRNQPTQAAHRQAGPGSAALASARAARHVPESVKKFLARSKGTPGYQVVHHFVESPKSPYGGVIQGSDGNLYGTTVDGGDALAGSVIRLDATGTLTVLHSFSGHDGAGPASALIEASDGSFYGTTLAGLDAAARGTAFKIDASGTLQTLHVFTGADGATPHAGLIQGSDGNFYGTTVYGGANDKGTVFRMDAAGAVTTLHSFAGSDGEFPSGSLVQTSDGNFYGMTDYGGAAGLGTVFKMHPVSGLVTSLHAFEQAQGNTPSGGLIQASDGDLYGATVYGGAGARGTTFKITTAGVLTLLHTFTDDEGARPSGGLMQGSDGNFYGTTSGGGPGAAGIGSVFKMSASGTVATLHFFDGSDGNIPLAGLIQGADGDFYGTTFLGSPWSRGTVFRMNAAGLVTTLTAFPATDAATPSAGLVQARDGNFYGTSQGGGSNFQGSVFKMDASGVVTLLHSFDEDSGLTYPSAELVDGRDGNLYGTTLFGGGDALSGTVFKVDASGVVTTLHAFSATDGSYPYGGLAEGFDGALYGTTAYGGTNNKGTIFKLSRRSRVVTTLHSFAGREGANPEATLVQGGDGQLYGTTPYGGRDGGGTVFKFHRRTGAVTTLHSFGAFSRFFGKNPQGGLAWRDGYLYGTTAYGGVDDMGTVFRMQPGSGHLTLLHSFAGVDGATPQASLIRGSDGKLYGTTYAGGEHDQGVVFAVTASNAVTTLHSFAGSDGARSDSRLLQGRDGYLYGTTSSGGSSHTGVIFRLPRATSSPAVTKR
jgi:uncharacterized repeat protein (TIGR03803 family)